MGEDSGFGQALLFELCRLARHDGRLGDHRMFTILRRVRLPPAFAASKLVTSKARTLHGPPGRFARARRGHKRRSRAPARSQLDENGGGWNDELGEAERRSRLRASPRFAEEQRNRIAGISRRCCETVESGAYARRN